MLDVVRPFGAEVPWVPLGQCRAIHVRQPTRKWETDMAEIGHGYGSEWHLLRYLGRHRERLASEVQRVTSCDSVQWLDFPSDPRSKWKDAEWKGLDFLPQESAARGKWAEFWPQTGRPPNWDAVGQVSVNGRREWLLVEAKAHLGEIESSCQASPAGGLDTIRAAFETTKKALGVAPDRDWLSGYYQFCNRVAVLHFLNSHDVLARLLFIYFTGDEFPGGSVDCPTCEDGWRLALAKQAEHVGLPDGHALSSRIHKLFLPVCS